MSLAGVTIGARHGWRVAAVTLRESTYTGAQMRVMVGDIQVEYVLNGPEDGTPIVLISGLYQSLTLWPLEFTTALSAAGFRVLDVRQS